MSVLRKPKYLSPAGEQAYGIIINFLSRHRLTYIGASQIFYSPAEWEDRKSKATKNCELIIAYDGSELRDIFNLEFASYNGYKFYNELRQELSEAGLACKECGNWFTAIVSITD